MQTCNNCLLDDRYPGITFNENSICSLCSGYKKFIPIGEEKLLKIFEKARKKKKKYDALVPISGGKDSAYILYLAVKIYDLKVLTMTYDNGFLSTLALKNINTIVQKTGVEHIFCKPDYEIQKKVYQNMFKHTGDICGACDIATKANVLRIAKQYSIPLILYGTSPLENDSFVPDSIQDISRLKYIMKLEKNITKEELKSFLVFPNLNLFKLSFLKKIGVFSKEIEPLFYIENPSDKEMGDIIKKELGWEEPPDKKFSKHFDCIAEPFTNYIRNKIYGYERRKCQYSNMIRRGELSRTEAIKLYEEDKVKEKPYNYDNILKMLDLNENDVIKALTYKPLTFEKYTSLMNKIFNILINK